jgi:hypothetical protein
MVRRYTLATFEGSVVSGNKHTPTPVPEGVSTMCKPEGIPAKEKTNMRGVDIEVVSETVWVVGVTEKAGVTEDTSTGQPERE